MVLTPSPRSESRWAAAIVLEIAYGVRVTSLDDQLVKMAERATVETVLAGSPGSMLVVAALGVGVGGSTWTGSVLLRCL